MAMCEHKKLKSLKEGFTFIEIMIVITIIGIFAGILLPNVARYMNKAKIKQAETTLRMLSQGIELYKAQIGTYPNTLKDLVTKPTGDDRAAKRWDEPFIKGSKVPEDPWGN